jgi:hypothetical protein
MFASVFLLHARSRRGGTLVETMVAASLVAMILGALAMSSSVCLGMVRAQRETVGCNLLLQERLEQLRAGGLSQINDATALCDDILGHASTQEPLLRGVRQLITVSTYPPVSPAASPLQVEKRADGTRTILSEPPGDFSLRNRMAVRVDLRVQWVSRQNGRIRSRETSTIVALGGLLR